MKPVVRSLLILIVTALPSWAQTNRIANGGFERSRQIPPIHWSSLWTRDTNVGQVTLDLQQPFAGHRSLRIDHQGAQDWSLTAGARLSVEAGDLLTFSGGARFQGEGSSQLCVITYDANDQVVDWSYGTAQITASTEWSQVSSRFIIPHGIEAIQPRIIGYGPGTAWWDEISLINTGNVFTSAGEPATQYRMENEFLSVTLDSTSLSLTVTDKRNGRIWSQPQTNLDWFVTRVQEQDSWQIDCLCGANAQAYTIGLHLEPNAPELLWTLNAVDNQVELLQPLEAPAPFASPAGTYLVLPMNEGISVPVEDTDFPAYHLITYGGHGLCMSFWGATDGEAAYQTIVETPDDAGVQMRRYAGLFALQPRWESQRGQFGPQRRLRFVFFDRGGHVAMAKRYRQYQQDRGPWLSLTEKRQANPNVDRLIGAVNVWNWDSDPLPLVADMQAAGIERILWSRRSSAQAVKALNRRKNVLTSRYDIYQDLMDPNIVATKLWGSHADWTQAGWPDDLMLDAQGNWREGWQVKGKDGQMYPCGTLCDRQFRAHAEARVPKELSTIPYRCRFIDTTTASPWRECYHPDHPMTRSDSRHWKMELLRYMSEEQHLVTGSETGHDAAVPYVHYFEGMMSLGPFRVPDAGRDMIRLWDEVPERVAKYQLGHDYRLPLWELVYHDSVVAQWYWGDYNNKLPSLWDKRDLFNALYATPPMFMFTQATWQQYRARFAQSYQTVCPLVRRVGYNEMTDHRFLTPDRSVQQTQFDNGVTVTVNFGTAPFTLPNGKELEAGGVRIEGME